MLAFAGQHEAAPHAIEELETEFALETADLPRERGLGDVAVAMKHALFHSRERGGIVSGGVEAIFSGPVDAVAEMLQRCRDGPPAARVDHVHVVDEDDPPAAGFEVKPTA